MWVRLFIWAKFELMRSNSVYVYMYYLMYILVSVKKSWALLGIPRNIQLPLPMLELESQRPKSDVCRGSHMIAFQDVESFFGWFGSVHVL